MRDIYFDEENNCLKNKLGIKSAEVLRQAEADLTIVRLKEILDSNEFTYGEKAYLALHKKMFGDIYPFAGEIRRIDIEKSERVLSGGVMLFTHYKEIEKALKEIFKNNGVDFNDEVESIIIKIRIFMTSIWEIHPFREGNTRTIITYMLKYLKSNNFQIDEGLLLSNFEYIRDSLVMSVYKNPMYLDRILNDSMERGHKYGKH